MSKRTVLVAGVVVLAFAVLAPACSSPKPSPSSSSSASTGAPQLPAPVGPQMLWGDLKPVVSVKELMRDMLDPEGSRISISFVQRRQPAAPFKASAKQISTRILHAGFVVNDLNVENKFYRRALGFRPYWYGGFKDKDIDWYEIQVPDGGDWIEYMLNIPANADHKELGVQNHFSLGVKDVGVAADQLKKQGLKTFDGPEVGRDGKNSLDAYDPDGTRVEVMEFTPRRTPCCHAYEAAHPSP